MGRLRQGDQEALRKPPEREPGVAPLRRESDAQASLDRRSTQLETVSLLQQAFASRLDSKGLYDLVGERVPDAFGAEVLKIVSFDHAARLVRDQYAVGPSGGLPLGTAPFSAATEQLIRSGEPRLELLEPVDPQAARSRRSAGTALEVPLVLDGSPWGAIRLQHPAPGAFDGFEQRLLVSLAASLGSALGNARLVAESLKTQSLFLANMSHELRTPLNAIIGYSEMIADELRDDGRADLVADVEKIGSAGTRLLGLIDDVLDFSKIKAGRIELELEAFDVGTLVSEAARTVRPLAEERGNALEVAVPPGVGRMRADPDKVRQVLLNLLSNAVKFTEAGAVLLSVHRSAGDRDDVLTFTVRDSGIGIVPEQLECIFDPFTQVDASPTRRYGGTGLGLAISRHFCRMMGGDLTVESEFGRGACFTARLPATVQEPDAAEESSWMPGC